MTDLSADIKIKHQKGEKGLNITHLQLNTLLTWIDLQFTIT